MVKKSAQNNASNTTGKFRIGTLLKGVILAYIITLPFFILFSLILSYTNFPEKYISIAVMSTTIISIIIASSVASKNIKSNGFAVGAFIGLLYILILFVFNGLVYKSFSVSKQLINMALICVVTGSVGGIIGVNLKPTKRKRIKIKK